MSRNRRKRKLPKCICGRHLIPLLERPDVLGCTILEYVHERNEEYLKFKRKQKTPEIEENCDVEDD